MGTSFTVTVRAVDRYTALRASEAALFVVAEVAERLSTWQTTSELSRFNATDPGLDFLLSPELESDLRIAAHWWEETDGAFDPGIASLVAAWDLRGSGSQPSATVLQLARSAAGLEHLHLGPGFARADISGFGIEEGGFGKGVALREAARASREEGAVCSVLNLGGHVLLDGECEEEQIEIAHPDQRDAGIARLTLRSGSVASSGNSERGLVVNGVRQGHIIDPRSGLPAADWGAVTVVAPDPVAADCISTALFVMGPDRGFEWLQGRPGIEAVFVERKGEMLELTATADLEEQLIAREDLITFLPAYHATVEKPLN